MARTKISEFSSTAADNTDIDGIDIAEGCAPSGINNAIRTLMADLKDMQTGASGDTFTFASLNATTANIDGGTIDGATIGGSSAAPVSSTNLAYTGTLTGGTGVINIGSGQIYKDSSGNVGIGTSSPTSKLHVSGTAGSVADFSSSIKVRNLSFTPDTYSGVLFETADGLNSYVTAIRQASFGGILAFGTNSGSNASSIIERMRIDSSGNLLVGRTTNFAGNWSHNIQSVGGSGAWPLGIISTDRGIIVRQTATTNGFMAYFEVGAGTVVGSISNTTTNVAYNTSSDYRLKEQVAPMTGALAKNELLNPVTYKWKSDGSDGQGFIAHELQAVFPDAVTGEKDAVDDEGKPVYQGVDTSFLVGHLVACVKELTTELNNVKAELAAMKGSA